ncbi:membrane protein insertase YidC [Paractinoplanes atraurantiacus]|uniref:Membrane protein insertase YidC n=1 Tax=Paractinoplanes atraurantiacus TaxID=1036182 RepID=A0A285KQ33_9ACTN|nr:membrane protein insertase YidC [Actinoplanes atraurantiacus]SNY74739.1 YidC/Oxa1 family membrane protein insertase [Actinoplanes atraurantiacus]
MSAVYTAISAVLLFWHALWERVLSSPDWPWILGIVFLVLTIRVLLLPLAVRQVKSQHAVQALLPRVRELGNDPEAVAALYRSEKVSPFAGFLPLLVQIPVFIGLLHVLRHIKPGSTMATLYGWTQTQFDSAAHAELLGAPIAATFGHHLGAPALTVQLVTAALIAVMIVTTYLSTRMSIQGDGLVQRLMLYGIPASLLISGVIFPLGVIVYWVTQNLFGLAQQAWIRRRYPMPGEPPRGADGDKARSQGATG